MSSNDPFAASSARSLPGGQTRGTPGPYPEGYFRPVSSFDAGRMVVAPFTSPNWMMNLLWMFVCELGAVVVIGRIVALGYMAEVAQARSGGKSHVWPDFVPERFSEYLLRGLWPFLWGTLWSIPLVVIMWVPFVMTIWISNALTNNGSQAPGAIVAIVGGVACIFFVVCFLLAIFASMIHSALANDFKKGVDFKWIRSYLSKVGKTTVIAGLLTCLIGMVASIAGFLFFCVGIFLVTPWMYLVGADAVAQLHDVFVSRGGRPAFSVPEWDEEIIEAQVVL